MTRRCLDLFSGRGGFSMSFRESDRWEVTTVDLNDEFGPDIQADVFELRPADLPEADVILASPPCNTFSKAANWHGHFDGGHPVTPEARDSVALTFHTVGLIRALDPEYWFLENPEGHLRKFLGRPTGSVTYCQYGKAHRKPTDLWGDHPPMTYRRCQNGDPCHRSKPARSHEGDGNHPAAAMDTDPSERARVPLDLSRAILKAVEGRGEQTELPRLLADGGFTKVADVGGGGE